MSYYVYIILCDNGSFYTGYTKDVDERIKLHTNGRGAKYTKMHKPKKIVYIENFEQRGEAMKREKAIKKLNHNQKQDLVNTQKNKKNSAHKIFKPTQSEETQAKKVPSISKKRRKDATNNTA